jgi:AraC family transcriptional regulator
MLSPQLQKRLFDVIYQAERNPAVDLSVAAMAERAGLSTYYFQRAFRSLTGESVKQYALRVRLQRAAFIIKWSNSPVIQVALDAGFETHAGFTKAFTRVYGKSPSAFREDAKTAPYIHFLDGPQRLAEVTALRASQLIVRFEEWPTLTIASKRYIGNTLGMVGVWPSLTRLAQQHKLLTDGAICLGLHYDDWDPRIEHKYRYDAAIVVPDEFDDGRVTISSIPGGQVAMLEFEGSLPQLDRTWWRFVNEWLPASGYQVRTQFVFDRYPASVVTGGRFRQILRTLAGIRATLCIPINRGP